MRNARMIGWCAAACVVVTATSCGSKKPLPVIDPLSNVSGHWQLDEQQSDNSADKIAAAMPDGARSSGTEGPAGGGERGAGGGGGRGGGFGGRRGGGGGGGRGGMGGGGGAGQIDAREIARRRQRAALTIDLAQDVSSDLEVELTPATVRLITHGMLDTLDLKTDGGKKKTTVPGQGDDDEVQITTRAAWSEGWLVVSREVDGGGKITETYLRASDNQHLYVVVQLELPRFGPGRGRGDGRPRTVEFRRVYDPAKGG
jgi:hypothetical protein